MKLLFCAAVLFVLVDTASPTSVQADDPPAQAVLFDFENKFDTEKIETRAVQVSLVGPPTKRKLQLATGHDTAWPGITLKPDGKRWDGSPYQNVSFDVKNLQQVPFELGLRIDNPNGDAGNNFTVMTQIAAGESRTVSGQLYARPIDLQNR